MPPPNAAPAVTFELLQAWASELGMDWAVVLKKADITGRATPWRMKKGTAGLESAKKIEKILAAEEEKRSSSTKTSAVLATLREWDEAGAQLGLLNPTVLEDLLARVKVVVDGERAKQGISHPLPEGDDD